MTSWLNLTDRVLTNRDYFTANIMFQCINGTAPIHLRNEVSLVSEIHDARTRSAENSNVMAPKPNIELFKKSFRYHGSQVWNALPGELKSAETIDYFKYLYKKEYF